MTTDTMSTRPARETVRVDDRRTYLLNHISWGAVFAGLAASLVLQLLLNMLGVGIGLASIDVQDTGDNPSASSFSIGAGIWWTISGILAAFFGGIVAGRLCGSAQTNTSRWHGFITWCGATLVLFYLLTSTVSNIVGGTMRTLGNAAGGVGQTAVTAMSGMNMGGNGGGLDSQVQSLVSPNAQQSAQNTVMAYLKAAATGDPQQQQAARQQAVNALAQSAGISTDEASSRLTQAEQQYRQTVEQAKQQAAQTAEVARKSAAQAGIFGFVALLLGAIAAWFGGGIGAVRELTAVDDRVAVDDRIVNRT
jgi:hypothetical protein